MNKIKLGILLFLLISSQTLAQSTYEFLRLDMSPRAAALGGGYVANASDPNVLFYNPAGIKTIEHIPISFSFVKHLMDINSASLASTFEIAGIGKFGAAIQYVNYGNFTEANQFGDRTGDFGAGDLALILGYANNISENFYYGANLKFIYSNIDDVSSTGLAVDLGLQYLLLDDGWNFGFSVLNLGSQLTAYYNTKEDLPLDVQLGLSKKLAHVPIQFFFSFNKLNAAENRFEYFNAGLEFTLGKAIELRFGYNNKERKDLKIGSTAGLAGYSLGLGVNISSYKFDYAFSSMGSIGALHRIGIAATLN